MNIYIESVPHQVHKYTFNAGTIVYIGRRPRAAHPHEQELPIEEPTASRQHLTVRLRNGKIEIKDMNSSNGTQVNEEQIEGNRFINVTNKDKIRVGESAKVIRVEIRPQLQSSSPKGSSSNQSGSARDCSSPSSSSSQLSRSREKNEKAHSEYLLKQFKISESTLKMLKQMTADRKSKQERIKFLKLMGCKNIEDWWDKIEESLKGHILFKSASKKEAAELEKQFILGRSNREKKGLGKS